MRLVLIGYRGSGKSTVARRLALALGWDWIDADVEIELAAGKSIAAIFADEGEPVFRDLESRVVAGLAERDRIVLAAGGGAILRAENRAALRQNAVVIWLKASVENILVRVARDESTEGRRPSLTTRGGEAEVRELLAIRTPFYSETADLILDTDDKTPDNVAAEVVELLVERGYTA